MNVGAPTSMDYNGVPLGKTHQSFETETAEKGLTLFWVKIRILGTTAILVIIRILDTAAILVKFSILDTTPVMILDSTEFLMTIMVLAPKNSWF